MAQTYSEFKTYVVTYLWRQNDTDLSNNMDILIQQANDELDVKTRTWQRRLANTVIMPETPDFDVSAGIPDCQAIRSVVDNNTSTGGLLTAVLPADIYAMRARYGADVKRGFYAIDRDGGTRFLRFVAPYSATDAGDLTVGYRVGIPDYAAADASWMEDEHLNLYLNTVLKHVAMFLREDERVQTYAQLMQQAFDDAEQDDKHNLQFGGSPLRQKPTRVVP